MSEAKKVIVTPVGTLVFEKNLFEVNKKGKYAAALMFKPEQDLKVIQEICAEAIKEGFPKGKPAGLRMPVKKQNSEEVLEKFPFLRGQFILNASTKFPIQVLDRNLEEIFKGDLKAGDECRFSISAYTYETGNKGVGLNLLGVQKIREGKALFERHSAKSTFSAAGGFGDDPVEESQQDDISF